MTFGRVVGIRDPIGFDKICVFFENCT